METNKDPRLQIYANLDNVQDDIEKAAKERKDEIRDEAQRQIDSLKQGVDDLKQEAKNSFEHYKGRKKDSDDPIADEKISIAKEASKVVEKNIEDDYRQTKDQIEEDVDRRLKSIDNMLEDSNDDR